MASQREQGFSDALQVEPLDHTEFSELLIDSLDPETESGVEVAWMQEFDCRVAKIDSGVVRTESWDVVRERLRRASGD
jgi:hypothetical protein